MPRFDPITSSIDDGDQFSIPRDDTGPATAHFDAHNTTSADRARATVRSLFVSTPDFRGWACVPTEPLAEPEVSA